MIKIFTGNDRVRAKNEILKFLGNTYEVYEGANLELPELTNIFRGGSLFGAERKILLRDLSENKSVFEKVVDYIDTTYDVAILEAKLDKRSVAYKNLKGKVEVLEYKLPENVNFRAVFDIYKVAKKDGAKAVEMLERIKMEEEPIAFAGLLNSQAIRDFGVRQGAKEKRTLKELSKLDLELKNSKLQPWLLVEAYLLRMSTWWQAWHLHPWQ